MLSTRLRENPIRGRALGAKPDVRVYGNSDNGDVSLGVRGAEDVLTDPLTGRHETADPSWDD